MSVHFSSDKMDWATPQAFFDELDREFQFVLDAACYESNCLCPTGNMIDNDIDGLVVDWHRAESVWLNPPYGREIGKWMKKAYQESQKGCTVVCLVPSRTDTKWWHDYAMNAAEIRLVKGRLKFGGAASAAPFPSAVVIFKAGSVGTLVTAMEATK